MTLHPIICHVTRVIYLFFINIRKRKEIKKKKKKKNKEILEKHWVQAL